VLSFRKGKCELRDVISTFVMIELSLHQSLSIATGLFPHSPSRSCQNFHFITSDHLQDWFL